MADLIWSCPACGTDLAEWWCPRCETLWAPPAVAAGIDPPDWSDDYASASLATCPCGKSMDHTGFCYE